MTFWKKLCNVDRVEAFVEVIVAHGTYEQCGARIRTYVLRAARINIYPREVLWEDIDDGMLPQRRNFLERIDRKVCFWELAAPGVAERANDDFDIRDDCVFPSGRW